ncbi:MAG: replication-associated recombination protein A [Gammaproteobacteria bacterium]|nr:replication-associated recombination protein A [Gammaproteobacteria bacterium]
MPSSDNHKQDFRPLADRMRPQDLNQVVGQAHLLGEGKSLRQALDAGHMHSMLFWGPPGTGKTTLARIIAQQAEAEFVSLSAVLSGVKDIRQAIEQAKLNREVHQRATILFVDEVHRFNKSQQDAFLPHVEDGTITFIGATTENPSFELNNALLSRVRVYVLKSIQPDHIVSLIEYALLNKLNGLGSRQIQMSDAAKTMLAKAADGDARYALTMLEIAADIAESEDGIEKIDVTTVEEVVSNGVRRFDKGGDIFYEQISALHKSIRGSSPDASLYWLACMLEGGCDPVYIARRLVRMASEDIGNADPRAMQITLNAWDIQERLGSPEGELALAQAVTYLACAAKSNAVYMAYKAARKDASQRGSLDVPMHLRNAPTKLMKNMDYGKQYRYAHDEPDGYAAGVHYFPDEMTDTRYYYPVDRGLEIKIADKLEYLRSLDKKQPEKR